MQKANKEKAYELPLNWVWGYLGDVTFNRDSERVPLSKEERSGLLLIFVMKFDTNIFNQSTCLFIR